MHVCVKKYRFSKFDQVCCVRKIVFDWVSYGFRKVFIISFMWAYVYETPHGQAAALGCLVSVEFRLAKLRRFKQLRS